MLWVSVQCCYRATQSTLLEYSGYHIGSSATYCALQISPVYLHIIFLMFNSRTSQNRYKHLLYSAYFYTCLHQSTWVYGSAAH